MAPFCTRDQKAAVGPPASTTALNALYKDDIEEGVWVSFLVFRAGNTKILSVKSALLQVSGSSKQQALGICSLARILSFGALFSGGGALPLNATTPATVRAAALATAAAAAAAANTVAFFESTCPCSDSSSSSSL
eukprot:m.57440 g.57440  ORF g.57440 m.57440 type:complete len:135 (-) comp15802_c0_seq3:919-1323(-)